MDDITGVDFSSHIIADLERKVRLRDQYNRTLSNTELAVL
jgi:glutathione synthase